MVAEARGEATPSLIAVEAETAMKEVDASRPDVCDDERYSAC
jgi:hypothetical protein